MNTEQSAQEIKSSRDNEQPVASAPSPLDQLKTGLQQALQSEANSSALQSTSRMQNELHRRQTLNSTQLAQQSYVEMQRRPSNIIGQSISVLKHQTSNTHINNSSASCQKQTISSTNNIKKQGS